MTHLCDTCAEAPTCTEDWYGQKPISECDFYTWHGLPDSVSLKSSTESEKHE